MKTLTKPIFEANHSDLQLNAEKVLDGLQNPFCEDINTRYQYYTMITSLDGDIDKYKTTQISYVNLTYFD